MKQKLNSEIKTERLLLHQCLSKNREEVPYNIFCGDDFVGRMVLCIDPVEGVIEPDIFIEKPFRRHGFALEAADAMINEIIGVYPSYELVAAVPIADKAANCLCCRLDFSFDGVAADGYYNVYYM
ncbi:MAG: hypothetical protein IJ168_11075 [Eubacterium sp.]|nr:hypothetical protein [Eubacterium sp.]